MGGSSTLTRKERQQQNKEANRARHRLWSLRHDVEHFVRPTLDTLKPLGFPVLANERCGSWYVFGYNGSDADERQQSCYFKSTDGHVGTWDFSLKRLNLHVIHLLSYYGGAMILDSSVRKEMPDSFSRTIPIWACVLNKVVGLFREDMGLPPLDKNQFNTDLHTRSTIVDDSERAIILQRIDRHVHDLYASKAIVDPLGLVKALVKPIRCRWVTPLNREMLLADFQDPAYYPLILINCSRHSSNRILEVDDSGRPVWYTPGAADDHEIWGRKLNPRVFWNNVDRILARDNNDDDVDRTIDELLERERAENDTMEASELHQLNTWDGIGILGISIGTRRAGRPPDCWSNFDAVLNVTDMEYKDMAAPPRDKYYLQLPVAEGKRDRTELERWLGPGIVFCALHAAVEGRRVLIHCAQGKDRSVALCLAVTLLFSNMEYPLRWKSERCACIRTLNTEPNCAEATFFKLSGMRSALVHRLLGREGRDFLLNWVRQEAGWSAATKEKIRIALHLVRQDREKAEPSRSTMQKLNRFFMSGRHDKS